VLLLVLRLVSGVGSLRRLTREEHLEDRAACLLAFAVRGLPRERGEWGAAMRAELAAVGGRSARWRFSLSCGRAAIMLRLRHGIASRDRGGGAIRAAILAAIAGSLGLALYGLLRYPGLRTGVTVWVSLALFLPLLATYLLAGLTLCRGVDALAARARLQAVIGGVLVGAAWLVLLVPHELAKQLVFVPLLVALLAPCGVALGTARAFRDAAMASAAALWSGIIGALLAFIVWVTTTYASDGRPYDAQLVRDFHASGARDLATYAVGDTLGAAVGLLVIIPVVALALGSLVARLAAGRGGDGRARVPVGS
jgi:hypothetical protein